MSTYSFSTIPEAFDFTSTCVIGVILPVATTERATSPRETFPNLLGSIPEPEARRAIPNPVAPRTTMPITTIQSHRRPFLRAAATTILQRFATSQAHPATCH